MCRDSGLWIDSQLNEIIDGNRRFKELRDSQ